MLSSAVTAWRHDFVTLVKWWQFTYIYIYIYIYIVFLNFILFIWPNDLVLIQVTNNTMYWSWLQRVFIPGVFSGRWYNGQRDEQTIYIGNKHSLLVGMARVRQLRVKASKFFFHFYYFLHFSEKAIYPHTLFFYCMVIHI